MKNILKIHNLIFILTFFILSSKAANAQEPAVQGGYYVGKIGDKMPVQMNININSNKIEGFYYYEKTGIPINIRGKAGNNGTLTIEELDEKNKITGIFKGRILPAKKSFEGTWSNPTGSRSFPFKLIKVASYNIKNTKVENKGMSVEVNEIYPTFLSDSPALKTIHSNIEKEINSLRDKFISEGKSMWSEPPESEDMLYMYQWQRTIEYRIAFYSDKIVSIFGKISEYTGGAHGNIFFSSDNFSIKQGKAVLLKISDLFVSDSHYMKALSDFCIKELRKQQAYYIVDGKITSFAEKDLGVFTLNSNIIRFAFAPYQVGPHAQGYFFVNVPYKDIKKYINPNGPLSGFVKK